MNITISSKVNIDSSDFDNIQFHFIVSTNSLNLYATGYKTVIATKIKSNVNEFGCEEENSSTILKGTVENLLPNTVYYYWIKCIINTKTSTFDYILDVPKNTKGVIPNATYAGTFKTFPSYKNNSTNDLIPYNFNFAFGHCNFSNTTGSHYKLISKFNPSIFLMLEDFHYWDDADETTSSVMYESAFQNLFASGSTYLNRYNSPTPNSFPHLGRTTCFNYNWGDHDFGDNNAGGDWPYKKAAYDTADYLLPHYDYVANSVELTETADYVVTGSFKSIYHSFNIGRVKFIITDDRGERDRYDSTESRKRVWSEEQENWFKHEVTDINYPVKIWARAIPFYGDDTVFPNDTTFSDGHIRYSGDDGWEKFPEYRTQICNFICENMNDNVNNIGKLITLHGDAHSTFLDDGKHDIMKYNGENYYTSSWYSTSSFRPNPPVTLACFGPLNQNASIKGGPYQVFGADLTIADKYSFLSNSQDWQTAYYAGSSSVELYAIRYGCCEIEDDINSITIKLYARSGITTDYDEAGEIRFPKKNGNPVKYVMTLSNINYDESINDGRVRGWEIEQEDSLEQL